MVGKKEGEGVERERNRKEEERERGYLRQPLNIPYDSVFPWHLLNSSLLYTYIFFQFL